MIQTENKTEEKIEQAEIKKEPTNISVGTPGTPEEKTPLIKSEENKANWKAFREQRESERKSAEEANRRAAEKAAEAEALRAALEALANKPTSNRHRDSHYEDDEETEEQRIDKRVEAIIKEREIKSEQERKVREHQELPFKLKQIYSDFDKVCNTENLDYLEYHHEEAAAALAALPDSIEKWSKIYKAIKKYVPNSDSKHDQLRAEKNLQKPGSISSPGNTHGGNAMPAARLDEARKSSNWERMQRTLKGLS